MANRPYLTSAEAAIYCGFKTIGGIQQAVRRGKLKPAGRRGGTGTYVFATEDLDLFLTGGLQPQRFVTTQNSPVAEAVATGAPPQRPHAAAAPVKSPPPAPARKLQRNALKQAKATDESPAARIVRALTSGGPDADKKSEPRKTRTARSKK